LAASTRRAYAHDWRDFRAWCVQASQRHLPAQPSCVARFLCERAEGHGRSTLARRLAAIGFYHRLAGHPWNSSHPDIRAVCQSVPRATRAAAVLGETELRRLMAACPNDLTGVRDRALLLLGYAAGLRRSEIVGLNHEDVRFTGTGLRLRLVLRSLGGEDACDLPRAQDAALCPVRVLEAWIVRAGREVGPLFRKVDRWGNVESARLGGDAVRRIVLHRAAVAGLRIGDDKRLTPDGLCAGRRRQGRRGPAPSIRATASE
jgi:site-specific recombinase XerC